ncbi:VOC family protein [Nitrosopumilus sp.]|uniref:VOC family protein n=1 Tax=Nitrosopumilus sp. TaxID=2024843 RepID=UPI002930CB27|nr:VOC family protein [Nitrosopumilus sp.]
MNPDKIDATREIKEAYKKAKSKGVEMSEPKKQPWGAIMSEFYDPDQNKYSLLENP